MTDNPESAFHDYIRAFETLDPELVLPFYHLPSLFIAPQGVFAAPDANTMRTLLAQFMGQLRAQSYCRTEVSNLKIRALSSVLASCTGMFVRFNAGGQEIARLGFTYTMRNSDGSWRLSLPPCMIRLRPDNAGRSAPLPAAQPGRGAPMTPESNLMSKLKAAVRLRNGHFTRLGRWR